MLLRTTSLRSVKRTAPSLSPIPENEICASAPKLSDLSCCRDLESLVAAERARWGLAPYRRRHELDRLAKDHAKLMATMATVFHSVSDIGALKKKLSCGVVGENVQRGDSIFSMHNETMSGKHDKVNRSNILSKHFTEFGSATVPGKDGKLYCCLVFRQRRT